MIIQGDCRAVMKRLIKQGVRVQTCVTSPPYWGLRDYGVEGQLGLEATPEEFIKKMVGVFRLVKHLLADDGTVWLNMGDSYAGSPGGHQGQHGQRSSRTHTAQIKMNKKGRGLKPKDMVGIPWMLAFALRADGWYLRQDIIWHKPNPMPESARDRCTKAHEYIFLLSKSPKYFYDFDAMQEQVSGTANARRSYKTPAGWDTSEGSHGNIHKSGRNGVGFGHGTDKGERDQSRVKSTKATAGVKSNPSWDESHTELVEYRNKRSVWTVGTQAFSEAHFATFPEKLIEPCILAGSRPGDIVLDPFNGSGTTGQVSYRHGREYIGIELNPEYIQMAEKRTRNVQVNMLTSQGLSA